MHFLGAYLDFDAFAVRPDDRGVQALVAIGLGHGNIVLEAPVHRLPLRMHQPQHAVAVPDVLDQHAEGHDIVHFIQGKILGLHLFPDAVLVLDAAVDLALHAIGGQEVLDQPHHLFDDPLFHHLMLFQPVVYLIVDIRLKVLEAQVFQVPLEQIQAQAVGQRRVDVHGFLSNAPLLVGLLKVQRAHIVQAVGQLDHEHPDVMAHGQNHLADVFGLRLFLVLKADEADLGHAVHNVGHFFAEIVVDFLDGGLGVLHRVMQQARGHRRLVKAHVGQGIGHRQRMGKIGFSRQARLPGMGRGRIDVGPLNQFQIGVAVVGRNLVENFLNTDHDRLMKGRTLWRRKAGRHGMRPRTLFDCPSRSGACQRQERVTPRGKPPSVPACRLPCRRAKPPGKAQRTPKEYGPARTGSETMRRLSARLPEAPPEAGGICSCTGMSAA